MQGPNTRRPTPRNIRRRLACPITDHPRRSESYGDILARAGVAEIDGQGKSAADDPTAQSSYAMHAHGAVFAEVKIDPKLGQIRVCLRRGPGD